MSLIEVTCSTVFFADAQSGSDKYYRTYQVGNWHIFQWGPRGKAGQFQAKQHLASGVAAEACRTQIDVKMKKGYGHRIDSTFRYDSDFMDGSKERMLQLNDIREASPGPQEPAAPKASPVAATSTPVQAAAATDLHGQFTERALRAISLAVTDPIAGAVEFGLLNAAWPELEQAHAKARSYLSTLDSLVIGANS